MRSIGELRCVVGNRRAAGGGPREVKGRGPVGPNGRLSPVRVVQIELDLLQGSGVPYEDVDLALDR
jgi:hypothetical protein